MNEYETHRLNRMYEMSADKASLAQHYGEMYDKHDDEQDDRPTLRTFAMELISRAFRAEMAEAEGGLRD